jgi:malate dehydrogenase
MGAIPVEYRLVAFVAVIGAGPLGGALAHKLALRERVAEVRLIDPQPGIAQGKALDILQSAPVEGFHTHIVAAQSLQSAAGARAILLADAAATGTEHAGEAGLALVKQIAAFEAAAPLVFAGAQQRTLMGLVVAELRVARARVVGTAPAALESALRTMTGLALNLSGVEVQLRLVGTPPEGVVVGWEEATAAALPLRTQLAPHLMRALEARIPKLWPPGPLALASAAARSVEAIVHGSRRLFTCLVALESGPARNAVAAMPVELGAGGVIRVLEPALSGLEKTQMDTAIERFAFRGSA